MKFCRMGLIVNNVHFGNDQKTFGERIWKPLFAVIYMILPVRVNMSIDAVMLKIMIFEGRRGTSVRRTIGGTC